MRRKVEDGASALPAARSVQGDRIARRAGGADDLERRPDEQELGHAVREQRREVEVLDVPDAMPGLQLGVAGYGLTFDFADRLGIVCRGVAAGQDDLLLGEVLAGAAAEARLAGDERLDPLGLLLVRERRPLAVLPKIAVARVKEDAVALADLLD